LRLKRIATVVNGVTATPDDWDRVRSKLVFEKEFVEGLYRLDHFKHIWVIFGFNRMRRTMMKSYPQHNLKKPQVGIFASRSPARPNKLGLTLVRLIGVRRNVVTVKGLDAFDGSPVYDIKPFEEEIDY
jgi:tRNA-Thr(GGU) m(6)t(6)A37 methyltransferase TsaA